MLHRVLLVLTLSLAGLPAQAERVVPATRQEAQMSFAPVVRRSAPAVVNIYATWVSERRASPFADDPFFSQFFERFGPSAPRVQNSLGSGVIVDAGGIVVSNYHVVQQATEIHVVLADRREFKGTVVLSDREADIAVMRLEGAGNLPALEFADSDAALVGDMVLAIGNPFGIGQTVSSGIVSATARSGLANGRGAGYLIQTDAPINPGNSGGALVDMAGRLLGLNTSLLTRSGGSNGIGFAIPANLVARYVGQVRAGRAEFARPWSGIAVQEVDGGLAQALDMEVPGGVLVSEAHPDSPFLKAGIAAGDVILSLGGLAVNAPAELEYRLLTREPGSEVVALVLRDGTRREVAVPVVEAPGQKDLTPVRIGGRTVLSGLVVADLTPRAIDEFDLPLSSAGVVVLDAEGPAVRLGLRGGDVLLQLNGAAIGSAAELERLVAAGGRDWDMELSRDGRKLRLQVRG
ncbi:trypsin-like peptidase domain-containing protein [Tropicimonas sp.]|uniref:trypsin-like peptidase domain-containing protein n=1 Tax=Tropicimonas sp. TaxID=2067044 RepID=UPI003A8C4D0E